MSWSLPEGCVLGLFAQRPDPDRVKPRLAAEFGAVAAAEIHQAMLLDWLDVWDSDQVLAPGGRRVVVFSPEDAGPWFDAQTPASWALQPQAGADLGARRHAFFAGEFEDGASRVVLISSDTPTLDPTIVISAFLCLEGRDVVLGPSTAGGSYLVGCRQEAAPIFEGIDGSTSRALAQTIDRLRDTGLSLAVLPPWYAIETPDDWRMLTGHLAALRRAGVNSRLPRIESLIELSSCGRCPPS